GFRRRRNASPNADAGPGLGQSQWTRQAARRADRPRRGTGSACSRRQAFRSRARRRPVACRDQGLLPWPDAPASCPGLHRGIEVLRADGEPAGRVRCAVRNLLAWAPKVVLYSLLGAALAISAAQHAIGPEGSSESLPTDAAAEGAAPQAAIDRPSREPGPRT